MSEEKKTSQDDLTAEDYADDRELIAEVRAELQRNPTPELEILLQALLMVQEERAQEAAAARGIE